MLQVVCHIRAIIQQYKPCIDISKILASNVFNTYFNEGECYC